MIEALSTPQSIGKRVKAARILSGLTREDFSHSTDISGATLRSWEDPKGRGGLTQKGVLRFIKALKKLNINCSAEWLLDGVGGGPQVSPIESKFVKAYELSGLSNIPVNYGQDEVILREVAFFKEQNPSAIVAPVIDDGMMPMYSPGDYVGGLLLEGKNISDYLKKPCIIQLISGDVFVRQVVPTDEESSYNLYCSNPSTKIDIPVLYAMKAKIIVPVLWHRAKG